MKMSILASVGLVLAVSAAAQAQVDFQPSQPTKKHAVLKKFVGTWENHAKSVPGPDQPQIECKGKLKSRMLGGLWVINEMTGDFGGAQMQGVQTIGYDPEKKKYVGIWVDSMMNIMWHYEGSLDESGKKLTLEAEGPNMLDPTKTARYRDTYEFKSDDHIVAISSVQGPDGKWVVFMTGDLTR